MNSIDKQLVELIKKKNISSYREQMNMKKDSYFVSSKKCEYLADYDFSSSEELEKKIMSSLSGEMREENIAKLCSIEIYDNCPCKSTGNTSLEESVIPDYVYAF